MHRLSVVLVTAMSACHGSVTFAQGEHPSHKKAVESLEELGAQVVVKTLEDGEKSVEVNILGARSRRQWKGDNGGLRQLIGLDNLRKVRIKNVRDVTDEGMAHLGGLKDLRMLWLWRTGVSDAGLDHLKELRNLEWLGLSSGSFTDAALEKIEGLNRLASLRLDDSAVTDRGIERLKANGTLKRLEFLSLSGTRVTDAGVACLRGATRLERLFLDKTKITDAGIAHLRGLRGLEFLALMQTGVTDSGVQHLKALAGLKNLYLDGAKVTYESYLELKRALPECRISWKRTAPLKIGDTPPEISIDRLYQAPDGAVASWKTLRGQVVVLEFWATWCAPCVRSIPHMNELAGKFKGKNVRFVAVTAEKEAVVKRFLEKRSIDAWIGFDPDRSMMTSFGVRGIPHTVVVGKTGRIHTITSPAGLTEDLLSRLLEGEET